MAPQSAPRPKGGRVSKKTFASTLALTLAIAGISHPALAQDTADSDVITVTALRREQALQDVPASISVISGQSLSDAGALASQDIAQLTPNVQWESTSLSNPRIFIRGIGSLEFNANGSGSVGIYVDDVFVGSPSALNFQLLDVQRVEVLRGPQGTLYGRNNTGGAINYISRDPTDHVSGSGTMRFGNYNLHVFEGSVAGPLGGGFSGRLTGRLINRDGVNENVNDTHDQWGDIGQWAARGKLRYDANNFDATLTYSAGSADQSSLSYQALGVYDPVALAGGSTVRCSDTRILAGECVNAFGLNDADPGDVRRAGYNASPHYDRIDTSLAALRMNWDIGFATLTSVTGLINVDRDERQDTDATAATILHANYANASEQFSQELRLASPGGERFNWIAGLYYLSDDMDASNSYETPAFPGGLALQAYTQNTEAWAVFARGDFAVTERLTASLGVRYTEEEKDFTTNNGFISTGTTLSLSRSLSNDSFSGDFVVDYALTDDLRVYGSIARGFKAGGVNGGVVFDPNQVTVFDPEYVTAYELGLKSQFANRRVTLNAAAFFYDYTDLQLQVTRDFGGGVPTPVVDNAGAAEVLGVELEGSWIASDYLTFNASLGLLETEFVEYVDFGGADYTGNDLPSAPGTSFSFGVNYERPIGAGLVFWAGADTSHRSHSYFTPENSQLTDRDASWITNARLGLRAEDGRWTAALWGRNLGDEEVRVGYANLDAFGYKLHSYEDPRTYGVEVTVRFE